MKTIILFLALIFCSTSFAQLGIYDMIVEYEQECFNDSSLQHTHDIKWYDRCLEQKGNMAEGYYYEIVCKDSSHYTYVHKEPDFAGFRDFIKQKYKKYYQVNK